MHRTTQEPGQAPREERFQTDGSGRRVEDSGENKRIQDVTDEEENGRKYEERMEDEYAKREGGA